VPVDPVAREKYLGWITDPGKKGGHASAAYTGESLLAEAPARIPFLSPTMTWATSGGMPIGHMGRWYGPEGSGKSMLNWGLIYCAQNYPRIMSDIYELEIRFWQRRKKMKAVILKKRLNDLIDRFPDGMSVLLFDTEQRAQLDLAARLGVDLHKDKFLMVEENVIEEITRQMRAAVDAYHLIIIDSASNAMSYAEANLEPGDYERGTAAAAWKRLRQVRRALDRFQNTIVFVDQMRMQLGTPANQGGPKAKPPQNRFLKHNVSVALEFNEGKRLYLNKDNILTDDRDKASDDFRQLGSDYPEVAGIEMRARVEKNSTGKPFRNSIMRFCFPMTDVRTGELIQDVGFDESFELLKIAEYFHIMESGGGGMFYLLDEDFKRIGKPYNYKGEPAAMTGMLEEEVRERVLTRIRIAT
jgi:RecA/RadA recombinase